MDWQTLLLLVMSVLAVLVFLSRRSERADQDSRRAAQRTTAPRDPQDPKRHRRGPVPAAIGTRTILSRRDADRIFTLTRPGWETYVQQLALPPGWTERLTSHATGTRVLGVDESTGVGLAVQPMFADDTSPPRKLVVGSYYPVGFFPYFTEDVRRDFEPATQSDLGKAYSVKARLARLPQAEVVELEILKA